MSRPSFRAATFHRSSYARRANCYRRSSSKEALMTVIRTHRRRHIRKEGSIRWSKGWATKDKAFWMWNPQNYGDYFKSRITFESYPISQDEVDEILRRFRLGARVIYDPPRM